MAERVTDDSGASLDDQAAIVFDETEDLPAFEGAVDELLPRRPSRDGVAE